MKIAICLSGFPNFTTESLNHFYHCISYPGAYIYAHAWKDKVNVREFPGICTLRQEEQTAFVLPVGESDQCVPPQSTFAQLYGISQAFKMALTCDYDLYVRCRFDVFVGNKIDYAKLSPDYVHMLPEGKNQPPRNSQVYAQRIGTLPLPKDFLWVCGKAQAQVCANLFDSIVSYNVNERIVLCPEDIIFHHFAKNDLKIKLLENNTVNGLYRQHHHHGDGLVIYDRNGPRTPK